MRRIAFTKAVASGNDFIIVDNVKRRCGVGKKAMPAFARQACERRLGIGADGLLIIERSPKADIRMRVFNPDGSEASMCGNGSRCAALYAFTEGLGKKRMDIETGAGLLNARIGSGRVKIAMTGPEGMALDIRLALSGKSYDVAFVDTGVPHAVIFCDGLEGLDVKGLGRELRRHDRFAPDGTNADFVCITGADSIEIRTYERGVEDETLACGTGSVAGAVLANALHGVNPPVKVLTRSGEVLMVYFKPDKSGYRDIFMEGGARLTYKGVYYYV